MLAGENIGEFMYLDNLEEKTSVNSLQMKYRYGKFHKFEGENWRLAINLSLKSASVFARQHFPLYGNYL